MVISNSYVSLPEIQRVSIYIDYRKRLRHSTMCFLLQGCAATVDEAGIRRGWDDTVTRRSAYKALLCSSGSKNGVIWSNYTPQDVILKGKTWWLISGYFCVSAEICSLNPPHTPEATALIGWNIQKWRVGLWWFSREYDTPTIKSQSADISPVCFKKQHKTGTI